MAAYVEISKWFGIPIHKNRFERAASPIPRLDPPASNFSSVFHPNWYRRSVDFSAMDGNASAALNGNSANNGLSEPWTEIELTKQPLPHRSWTEGIEAEIPFLEHFAPQPTIPVRYRFKVQRARKRQNFTWLKVHDKKVRRKRARKNKKQPQQHRNRRSAETAPCSSKSQDSEITHTQDEGAGGNQLDFEPAPCPQDTIEENSATPSTNTATIEGNGFGETQVFFEHVRLATPPRSVLITLRIYYGSPSSDQGRPAPSPRAVVMILFIHDRRTRKGRQSRHSADF